MGKILCGACFCGLDAVKQEKNQMPPKRRRATDFFSPEPASETRRKMPQPAVVIEQKPSVRRSSRLHTSPIVEIIVPAKKSKSVLELGQAAKKISPKVPFVTPLSKKERQRQTSGGSNSTEDVFVDAREFHSPVVRSIYPKLDGGMQKSPQTEEPYVSAPEDVDESPLEEVSGAEEEEGAKEVESDKGTPRPSTRSSDKIPSSQPRPRTERTPVPLQVRSTSPIESLPPSTNVSDVRSTQNSVMAPPIAAEESIDEENTEDSDDEAPEAISLSQSRSKALQAESQISQATKAQADKTREKRRRRDELLATQKQSKRQKVLAVEIPISDQNLSAEVSTGTSATSIDVPAPNQDHQAARLARHAEALPTSILQAASESWLQTTEAQVSPASTKRTTKKRKDRDDGVRILEKGNPHLPPKSSAISIRKEKMIMRMGRGERKMFIGRFTR